MLTGSEYVASLDDGRSTYFDGRAVPDLLAEPAFETPIRAIAAGYDRHYSPEPERPTHWSSRRARRRSSANGRPWCTRWTSRSPSPTGR